MNPATHPRPRYDFRSPRDVDDWTKHYPIHVRFLAKKFQCPEAAIQIIGYDDEPCVIVRGKWAGYADCYWNEIQGLPEAYEGEFSYYLPERAA